MQLTNCYDSMPCSCAINCIEMGGDPFQCQAQCMANDQASNALLNCGLQNCQQQCI
jgi:hypothetical protein